MEAEFEMGDITLSLKLSAVSEDLTLDLEANSANSPDQKEELMLSASDSEGLDVQ